MNSHGADGRVCRAIAGMVSSVSRRSRLGSVFEASFEAVGAPSSRTLGVECEQASSRKHQVRQRE
jgi:hypothetical protein